MTQFKVCTKRKRFSKSTRLRRITNYMFFVSTEDLQNKVKKYMRMELPLSHVADIQKMYPTRRTTKFWAIGDPSPWTACHCTSVPDTAILHTARHAPRPCISGLSICYSTVEGPPAFMITRPEAMWEHAAPNTNNQAPGRLEAATYTFAWAQIMQTFHFLCDVIFFKVWFT